MILNRRDASVSVVSPFFRKISAAKLGCEPGQSIVLEDSSNGALAGKRAGCYTIGVPSECSRGQDFSFVDFVAPDLLAAEKHISELLTSGF